MDEIAIRVEGLGKRYSLGQPDTFRTLRDVVAGAARSLRLPWGAGGQGWADQRSRQYIWALKDLSFEVRRGEAIGIIGHNGAGKSTLLKILARITEPTEGCAAVRGRVGSLLEVGTGFNPELTGRENIFLNGSILGMRRAEIQHKFDEIVAFAEVEAFLDTPIKRYSSGMHMRLAFAVAAHLEPEIMIVDEVLAVGDAAFQKKCMGKMDEVTSHGRTVLFVSHSTSAISSLCDRVILIERGQLKSQGPAREVVQQYLQSMNDLARFPLSERHDRTGDGSIVVEALGVESLDSDKIIRPHSRLKITLQYRSTASVRQANFLVSVSDAADVGIYLLQGRQTRTLPEELPPEGVITCITEPINLTPGRCFLHLEVMRGSIRADYVPYVARFDVEAVDIEPEAALPRDWVLCLLGQRWSSDGSGVASE